MTPSDHSRCSCWTSTSEGKALAVKVVPSASLSLLIAFFPKCPVCWAVYMSMFGGLGLAKLPYQDWLLPALLCLMGIHLLVLLRKASRIGYLPFALSLTGSLIIVCARLLSISGTWVLLVGMALVVSGSVLNGLTNLRQAK